MTTAVIKGIVNQFAAQFGIGQVGPIFVAADIDLVFAQNGLEPFIALVDCAINVGAILLGATEEISLFGVFQIFQQGAIGRQVDRFVPLQRHGRIEGLFFFVDDIEANILDGLAGYRQFAQGVIKDTRDPVQLDGNAILGFGMLGKSGDKVSLWQTGPAPTADADFGAFRFERRPDGFGIRQIEVGGGAFGSRRGRAGARLGGDAGGEQRRTAGEASHAQEVTSRK